MTFLPDATLDHLRDVAAWPEFIGERYVVHEEIGRGGMGAVYAATDSALGREVAVKIGTGFSLSGQTPPPELSTCLTREARVIASLEHPGIVPVHDYGLLADGRPFYVMKRVDGRTLDTHLTSALAPAELLRIFERIADAVSFAHARGGIHRDLKPSNVMIGSFGEVLVMDFGAALVAARPDANEAAVIGTRGFMAPEQAAGGSGRADARSDVHALGAVLAAMLPSDAPRPLRSICRRATAVDPALRYASVEDMAADVRRFRDGASVLAHRENLLERAARFGRRYQVAILLVLAYVVMRALIAVTAGV